jgi:hypothetical protein
LLSFVISDRSPTNQPLKVRRSKQKVLCAHSLLSGFPFSEKINI